MSRWRLFRRSFAGFDTVVLGNQVHGIEVRSVGRAGGWVQVEGVDGWVTTEPGVLLTVTVADCIPVYLAAPGTGGRAAACGLARDRGRDSGARGGAVERRDRSCGEWML